MNPEELAAKLLDIETAGSATAFRNVPEDLEARIAGSIADARAEVAEKIEAARADARAEVAEKIEAARADARAEVAEKIEAARADARAEVAEKIEAARLHYEGLLSDAEARHAGDDATVYRAIAEALRDLLRNK